ncbi:unnamed protein product [Linum trigynum]|uniref:Tetraspanin n=1 Tax=Linum trigynum TaxID=586398 RepID=A0AAV2DAB7_9ROSI
MATTVSNVLVAIINTILLVLGLMAVGTGLYLMIAGDSTTQCRQGLERPLLITGAALVGVAAIGLVGSCCRNSCFIFLYLIVMFAAIVLLALFTIFLIFVTNQSIARTVTKLKIYNLDGWLRRYYVNDENWGDIKSCLIDARICYGVVAKNRSVIDFIKKRFSSTRSGCCTPPSSCGFTMRNETFWIPPKKGIAAGADPDCNGWSNKQNELCYDCESCKASFVYNIKQQWRSLAIINVCVLILAISVYVIGCCARFSKSSSSSSRKYLPGKYP